MEAMFMKTVSSSAARQNLPEFLGEVGHGKQRVVIERRGKPVAVLVSIEDLEAIEKEEGQDWDDLRQVLPELNERLDRMITTLKSLRKDNRAFRKEIDRLHTQRQKLLWRS
jgi:prevent-host-death family protein